jgi:REP element-mobilizing transposase RayT
VFADSTILNMPTGLKRYYGANDLHFVTSSCYQRCPWLGTAERRDLLLDVSERVRQKYVVVMQGYVVMPEHIHLLLSEPQVGTISVVMQALKLGFARRVLNSLANGSHCSDGPLLAKNARNGAPSTPANGLTDQKSCNCSVARVIE